MQTSAAETVIERFSKEQVLDELRAQVAKSNTTLVAASLGVTRNFISMVMNGKRDISDDIAFRMGFIKLPDAYMRAPKPETT